MEKGVLTLEQKTDLLSWFSAGDFNEVVPGQHGNMKPPHDASFKLVDKSALDQTKINQLPTGAVRRALRQNLKKIK